jgi:hypothetical protein
MAYLLTRFYTIYPRSLSRGYPLSKSTGGPQNLFGQKEKLIPVPEKAKLSL